MRKHILYWVATNALSCWKARRMKMAHTELDLRERRAIEGMLNAKVPVSKIAIAISRHRSTVFREIKRNKDLKPPINRKVIAS
jgi:hypothetical protein